SAAKSGQESDRRENQRESREDFMAVDGDSFWYHSDEDNKTVVVKECLNVETMYRPYQLLYLLAKYRKRSNWKVLGEKVFHGQQTVAVDAKCEELTFEGTLYFDKSTGLLAGLVSVR